MPNWQLKRIVMENGKPTLESTTRFDKRTVEYLKKALAIAAASKCTMPVFSGFHVRGMITTGDIGLGFPQSGNVEYGNCQALHNEESAVAALISRRGSSEVRGNRVVAIVAGKGNGTAGNFTAPCGNCRDILRDVVGENCLIVSGAEGGGTAIVMELSTALFDRYTPIPFVQAVGMACREGVWSVKKRSAEVGHNPYYNASKYPLRNYAVGIWAGVDTMRKMYDGAMQVHEDFHPTYPIELAGLQMWLEKEPDVGLVVVVAEGDGSSPPDVMYRDRQRLLSMVIEKQLLTRRKCDPPVHLFTYLGNSITGAWKTTAKKWLPLPFSPLNFGGEFLQNYKKYLKEKYRR